MGLTLIIINLLNFFVWKGKNVTARKLKTEEINHLTSILLKWAKLRSNNSINDSFNNLSNGLNNKINKSTIKLNDTLNSQRTPQHLNIQDISVILIYIL